MKYLCIGYFDREQMHARPKQEIDALLAECGIYLKALYASNQVLFDVGITEETKYLQRVNGVLTVADSLNDKTTEMIGGVFLIEARDMNEATHFASLHPATQLLVGEQLGWRTEIRPVHYFQLPSGSLKGDLLVS